MSEIKELDAILRSHLSWFIRKVFQTVAPGETYLHAWYIDAMAYELERVLRGETSRLLITIPPRHLKSICASVAFPAWVLGHDPTCNIICVSYSESLAIKHANDCRAVMESA